MVLLWGSGNSTGSNYQRVSCFDLDILDLNTFSCLDLDLNLEWTFTETIANFLCPIFTYRFMASKQYRTGKPEPSELVCGSCDSRQKVPVGSIISVVCWTDEVFRQPLFHLNTVELMSPFCFRDWLDKQKLLLTSGQTIDMFGAQFETEVMDHRLEAFLSSSWYWAGISYCWDKKKTNMFILLKGLLLTSYRSCCLDMDRVRQQCARVMCGFGRWWVYKHDTDRTAYIYFVAVFVYLTFDLGVFWPHISDFCFVSLHLLSVPLSGRIL